MKIKNKEIAGFDFSETGEFCCTICGAIVNITRFKGGYICNHCLQYVKSQL